jgi:hypothetical protein
LTTARPRIIDAADPQTARSSVGGHRTDRGTTIFVRLWSSASGGLVEAGRRGAPAPGPWPTIDLRPARAQKGVVVPLEGDWPDPGVLAACVQGARAVRPATPGLGSTFARWLAVAWGNEAAGSLDWLCQCGLGEERRTLTGMRGPTVTALLETTRAVLDALELHEDGAVRTTIRACRGGAAAPVDPRLEALAGVPPMRAEEAIGRLRVEVRRLFGREGGVDEVRRLPDTGPPLMVVVQERAL